MEHLLGSNWIITVILTYIVSLCIDLLFALDLSASDDLSEKTENLIYIGSFVPIINTLMIAAMFFYMLILIPLYGICYLSYKIMYRIYKSIFGFYKWIKWYI